MTQQQQQENNLELESQFILRLPPDQAESLRAAIKSGSSLVNRLSIQLNNDMRHGNVKFDETVMPAKLLDLPAVIESYKTLDRKNLYKTADISQILVCKEDANPSEGQDVVGRNNKREFCFPHGITPPLKNVRKRRFRKTMKKKFVDTTDIEKEVRRLFQFDCRAIDVRYEVIEQSKLDSQPTSFALNSTQSPMSVNAPGMQSTENSQNLDLVHDLFGEECTSSDESDDDDDDDDDEKDDDNDNDIERELDSDIEMDNDDREEIDDDDIEAMANELSQAAVPDIAAEEAAASNLISQNEDTEEKKQELNKELVKIRERIKMQESEMNGLDNLALRQRLQSVLDSLLEQEEEIKKQIEELFDY